MWRCTHKNCRVETRNKDTHDSVQGAIRSFVPDMTALRDVPAPMVFSSPMSKLTECRQTINRQTQRPKKESGWTRHNIRRKAIEAYTANPTTVTTWYSTATKLGATLTGAGQNCTGTDCSQTHSACFGMLREGSLRKIRHNAGLLPLHCCI